MHDETKYSITLLLGTGLTALLSVIYVIIVGRMLGPEEAADFFAAISFCLLFISISAPINDTVTRFTSLFFI